MNLFKNLINQLAESDFKKLVLQFVATRLDTDEAFVLLTDARQSDVYDLLVTRLCSIGGSKLGVTDMNFLHNTIANEIVIVHSCYDDSLLRKVVEESKYLNRVIYVAETSVPEMDEKMIQSLRVEYIVDIVFAYNDRVTFHSHLKRPDIQGALNLRPGKSSAR